MRIVAGEFRGRTINAPSGASVRPTSDRVREALFGILEHADYGLAGARVIDLFAGSGALGLEALSRGASFALFVEEAASARASVWRNIESLGLTGRTRLFRRDATHLGPLQAGLAAFDLAFIDPPYGLALIPPALHALQNGGWLAPGAHIIAEMRGTESLELSQGFELLDERTYGETKLLFLEADATPL
jgi:16S rRNA (guanine966-N2)-methyltransferase